jgi:hypothetical protein
MATRGRGTYRLGGAYEVTDLTDSRWLFHPTYLHDIPTRQEVQTRYLPSHANVAELADAQDLGLGSGALRRPYPDPGSPGRIA